MAIDDDISIISKQLEILEDHHLLADLERKAIMEQLKKSPANIKLYAESLSKGLPGLTKGLIGAVKAGKGGDPFAISMAAVDIFAGIVTIAGPLLGPAGAIVSALAGMVSSILAEFLPKPPSLKEEITTLLDKFLAEEKLRNLGTALDEIWILSDTIQNHSLDYKSLNLQHGKEITAIDDAWQWLKENEKQKVPLWGEVLEKTCMVWIQLLRCVSLSVIKPSTSAGEAKGAMLVYLPARQELFLKYLRLIKPVAIEKGLYIECQAWNSGGVLYASVGQAGKIPFDYKRETGWIRNFSISVPPSEMGSSKPTYDLIACTEKPNAIVRYQVTSEGDLSGGQTWMEEHHDYPNAGSGWRTFQSCVNAWAIPDDQAPESTRVYTAHAARPATSISTGWTPRAR